MFAPEPAQRKQNQRAIGLCLVLALGTLLLYWPVVHHPFVTLDDNQYVTENPQVQAGLTVAGLQWAFTNTAAANWHPLTWLSHMLDCQIFGLKPAGPHLVNVFFHIANTLLLFFWLKGLTGALWRSALVAALFAWHPLHVESVAWVAERKDVLSAFFWLLTLLTYTRYAQRVPPEMSSVPAARRRAFWLYGLTLFWFACGLMSKPMVVTLPFVLLLVDFWPLKRIGIPGTGMRNLKAALLEKLPFMTLVIAECVLNLTAQKGGGATWSNDLLPLTVRLANALVSYLRYLSKTFWPSDLAVIYPYKTDWPLGLVLAAALFLFIGSALAVWRRRQNPYLFFGWFYFLGTLVPTIGLVQVGPQAMADRYTYLPSIGLFVMLVWGMADLLATRANGARLGALIAIGTTGACALFTTQQLKYWAGSVELFAHTVAVTTDNYAATAYLGGALESAGRKDEALLFYTESVRITPYFPIAQWGLGLALLNHGRAAEASEHFASAAELTPADPVIRCYHGRSLYLAGQPGPAEKPLTEALRLKPDYAEAHFFLALCLAGQNKPAAALPHFAEAVRLAPDNADAQFNLGTCLLENERWSDGVQALEATLKLRPNFAPAHFRLGQALVQLGKKPEAAAQFREVLRLNPDDAKAKQELDALSAAPAAPP